MTAIGDILQMALDQVDMSIATDNYIQEVQNLCSKLADVGEETLFISVNLSGNRCAYLGSSFGKEYIEKNSTIQEFFQFCCDKYSKTSNVVTKATVDKTGSSSGDNAQVQLDNPTETGASYQPNSTPENQDKGESVGLESSHGKGQLDKEVKNEFSNQMTKSKQNEKGLPAKVLQTNLENSVVSQQHVKTEEKPEACKSMKDNVVSTATRNDKNSQEESENTPKPNDASSESKESIVEEKVSSTSEKTTLETSADANPNVENDTETGQKLTVNTMQIGRRTGQKTAARSKAIESKKAKTDIEMHDSKTSDKEVIATEKKEFHMRTRSGGKVKHLPWLQKTRKESSPNETSSLLKTTKRKEVEENQTPGKRTKIVSVLLVETENKSDAENEVEETGTTTDSEVTLKIEMKHENASDKSKKKELKKEFFKCDVCSKQFATERLLKMHRKVHNEGQFICLTCHDVFNQERQLRGHQLDKHKEEEVSCEKCNDSFQSSEILDIHLFQAHDIQKDYACQICPDVTITGIHNYKNHMKNHLPKCTCEVCGKICCKPHELKLHMRKHTHEKPFKCKTCDRSFARSGTLYMHTLTHRDYKAFQCEICGRCFKIKESLRQHRRVHVKESIFCCDYCDQKFRTFDGKKNHVVQFHKEVRDNPQWKVYSCEYCKKDFGAKQQFIRHLSVHTGNRPHTCDKCGKGYPTVGALNTHKKSHNDEKPFKCLVCSLSFNVFSKMKRHIETQKHIQICSNYGVDPKGNLKEYEEKLAGEGKLRTPDINMGVTVPVDGNVPVNIKKEVETTGIIESVEHVEALEGEELVECVLIHIPENSQGVDDSQTNIIYSINTEDGTIQQVYEERTTEVETS